MKDDFVRAYTEAGETPCERFSCDKVSECASAKLACSAFRLYVRSGHAMCPSKRFVISSSNRFKESGWRPEIEATSDHYDAAMRD